MTDITAIGEILIDLTQTGINDVGVPLFAPPPLISASLPSKSLNFAGKTPYFFTCFPSDSFAIPRLLCYNGCSIK